MAQAYRLIAYKKAYEELKNSNFYDKIRLQEGGMINELYVNAQE